MSVLLALVLLLAAGSASAASWTAQDFAVPLMPYGSLESVSCPAQNDCTAVGTASGGAGDTGLAEHWNGAAWAMRPLPDALAKHLLAVSCSSSTSCLAVGSFNGAPLAEQWDGAAWVQTTPPDPGDTGALNAVSCTTGGGCMAVGVGDAGALVAQWSGSAWTVLPSAASGLATELGGVSCDSAADCTAVGASATSTLVEHWDGSSWALRSSPDLTGATGSRLESVACRSETDCTAVGAADYAFTPPDTPRFVPLAEHWNGSAWTIKSTPAPAGSADLISVACPSGNVCTAVGYTAGQIEPLIETSTGSGWSVAGGPAGPSSALLGVACTAASTCFAVGEAQAAAGPSGKLVRDAGVTLAARTAGSGWAVTPTQDVKAPSTATVDGVSCSSASACTAVGSYSGHSDNVALTERWNGAGWTTQASAQLSGAQPLLQAVACPSASDCLAVGSVEAGAQAGLQSTALSEQWNGAGWTVKPTAPITEEFQSAALSGISCRSESDCTAIGALVDAAGDQQPLIERWNGHVWTRDSVPNPNGTTVLSGVSCGSASACVAVGTTDPRTSGALIAIAEVWNGQSWATRQVPAPAAASESFLNGVSCASASYCVAVGSSEAQSGAALFAVSFNGSAFAPSPTPPGGGNLEAVSCPLAGFCMATGESATAAHTLAERWDGSAWTPQPTPDRPNGSESGLHSVSCVNRLACLAVGEFYPAVGVRAPMADRYTDVPPSVPPQPPARRRASALVSQPPAAICRTDFRRVLRHRSGTLRFNGRLSGSFAIRDRRGRVLEVSYRRGRYALASPRARASYLSGVTSGMVLERRRSWRLELSSHDGRLRLLVGWGSRHTVVVHTESCWPMRAGDLTVYTLRHHGLRVRLLLRIAAGAPIASAALTVTDGRHVHALDTGRSGTVAVSIPAGPDRRLRVGYAGNTAHLSTALTLQIRNE